MKRLMQIHKSMTEEHNFILGVHHNSRVTFILISIRPLYLIIDIRTSNCVPCVMGLHIYAFRSQEQKQFDRCPKHVFQFIVKPNILNDTMGGNDSSEYSW